MQTDNILKDAIAEAKTLRKLSMSNARHSLVKFLKEEKLPLDDLADAELDLDHFVDLIMKRSREREKEDDELNSKGLPYLRKQNTDDELDERGRIGMHRELTDDDEFEIDYGDGNVEKSGKDDDDDGIDDEIEDDEKEDEENFSDNVIDERIRKWHNLHGRRNFRTSPAVRPTKLTKKERELLIKHAGLLKENKNFNQPTAIKDDLLRQRAGIKENTGRAKQMISDLDDKNKILIG